MKLALLPALLICFMGASLTGLAQVRTHHPAIARAALLPATPPDLATMPESLALATEPDAQEPNELPAVWRLTTARRAIPTGPGRRKEVRGVLISDAQGKQIRFEAKGRARFVVPYERISAMHYEQEARRFLRMSGYYLTVHYLDVDGRPAFETIRVVSEREALAALGTLERDTGRTFDRSGAARSFLGIPIRARIGARVAVTDQTGQTTKGAIAQLSASSLVLEEPKVGPRVFDETTVRKIRLLYSPKHDALVGLGTGAAYGVGGVYLSATLGGCFTPGGHTSDCHVLGTAAAIGAVGGGLGAAIGATIGAFRYPFNNVFDVYRGDVRSAYKTSAITIVPQATHARKEVLVSIRF